MHVTVPMVVPPPPNQRSELLSFNNSTKTRAVNDSLDLLAESLVVVLGRNNLELAGRWSSFEVPPQKVKASCRGDRAGFARLDVESSNLQERLNLVENVHGVLLRMKNKNHVIRVTNAGIVGMLDCMTRWVRIRFRKRPNLLNPVERDISQQGANYPSNNLAKKGLLPLVMAPLRF